MIALLKPDIGKQKTVHSRAKTVHSASKTALSPFELSLLTDNSTENENLFVFPIAKCEKSCYNTRTTE